MPLETAAAYGAPDRRGDLLLEAVDPRAEREPPRAEHLDDELLLPLVEPGRGEADLRVVRRSRLRRHDVSTTSSQCDQRSLRPLTVSR